MESRFAGLRKCTYHLGSAVVHFSANSFTMAEQISLEAATRRYKEPISWFSGVRYGVAYYALHYFIVIANNVLAIKERFITPKNGPTFIKRYPCRPKLPLRYVSHFEIDEIS